jgi:radical SAM protein with 4Fe4S-binding SPASM domain
MHMSLLSRVVVPLRLSLILRDEQAVAYNSNFNVWHRVDDETAEVLRWFRAGRDRSALAAHLTRRFGLGNAEDRLEAMLRWAILRQLLYLDAEPALPSSYLPSEPPSTVYWICTQGCNLRCTYCYQDASVARDHELSTAEGYDLVDQALEAGVRTFVFTGGEPFHRRDLLEIARYSKSRGLRTNVITNGGYVTARRAREIAQIFDKVTVSLDHAVAAHHDRERGKGSWRRPAKAIDLLMQQGVNVDINSVLSRSGLPDVDKLLAFVRSRPIGQHRITPRYPMGRGADSRRDELTPEELLDLDDNLHRASEALDFSSIENRAARYSRATKSKGLLRSHCGAGLSEVSIDPEGWVYPCKLLQKKEYRAGNIRDHRLVEIFSDDPVLASFRRPFVDTLKPCTTCIIKNDCGGGCRGIHSSFSQDWTVAEPLFCAQLRRSFETSVFASTGSVPVRKPPRFICANGISTVLGVSQGNLSFIPIDQLRSRQ